MALWMEKSAVNMQKRKPEEGVRKRNGMKKKAGTIRRETRKKRI